MQGNTCPFSEDYIYATHAKATFNKAHTLPPHAATADISVSVNDELL